MNLKKGGPEPIFMTGDHNIVPISLILNCMKNNYHNQINNYIISIK